MAGALDRIKEDAEQRVLKGNDGNAEFLLYLDRREFKKGDTLDIVTAKLEFDRPAHVVFVDDEPGKNFAHRCHYLLYGTEDGAFLRKVPASFPHFMFERPKGLELFRTSPTVERFRRVKRLRMPLDLPRQSSWAKFAPFPLRFRGGRRYAILFSGASNGRHVNDLEFLYRTLLDVYGFDAGDVYVLNYDGTINYNQMPWETAPAAGFGPDGSAWRIAVNGTGDRAGFQGVITDLGARIHSSDCLFIHTNNHGGYDGGQGDGFLVTPGQSYYAADFAADLAGLPAFRNLLVVMEQCNSGSFGQPVLGSSPATNTVFQAAVPWDQSSAGGWPFDPWAEMWISAMAGVRGDGSSLTVSPDDDLNSRISAWEAYDYAVGIDSPVIFESSADFSKKLYLSGCGFKIFKEIKEWKEFKEPKEWKEFKEPKEWKEAKEFTEPKRVKEILEPKHVKELEPKSAMEPKLAYEGPEMPGLGPDPRELHDRIVRLERAVEDLEPFIGREERPRPPAPARTRAGKRSRTPR
jgi:hypothetical protein